MQGYDVFKLTTEKMRCCIKVSRTSSISARNILQIDNILKIQHLLDFHTSKMYIVYRRFLETASRLKIYLSTTILEKIWNSTTGYFPSGPNRYRNISTKK